MRNGEIIEIFFLRQYLVPPSTNDVSPYHLRREKSAMREGFLEICNLFRMMCVRVGGRTKGRICTAAVVHLWLSTARAQPIQARAHVGMYATHKQSKSINDEKHGCVHLEDS